MSLDDLAAAVKNPQPDLVDRDLPCQTCGYNLRTLSVTSLCPECGGAVGLSFNENLLADANPRYVLRLARGAGYILRGIQLMIAGGIIALLIGVSIKTWRIAGIVALAGLYFGIILSLIGVWDLSTPDPSGLGENRCRRSRRLVRIAVVVFASCEFSEIFLADWRTSTAWFGPIIAILASLTLLVGYIAQMRYLRHLAIRAADRGLARFCERLGWFGAVAGSITCAGAWWAVAGRPRLNDNDIFAIFMAIDTLGTLVIALMSWWALGQLAPLLREQAKIARRRRIAHPIGDIPYVPQ